MVSAHGDNGNCKGIPSDAVALSLNVTATGATDSTFLTIWEAGVDKPVGSSLNPSPGAPPTPNAVTTKLSPSGQFNVFNRFGSVNVLIDINGYYVDHNHDDRYDTTAEVDAKIAGATADADAKIAVASADADAKIAAQAELGPTVIDFSMLDMAPLTDGTGWSRAIGYNHTGGSNECLTFPFDAVPGQMVTGARLTYVNESGGVINVQLQVLGLKTTPGPIPGGISDLVHQAIDDTQPLPVPVPGSEIVAMTSNPAADATLRDGFRYAGATCTADDILVLGAQVTLSNP